MTVLWQDLRFGVRLLRRQPGFTLLAALVLSLGIGATTASFSLVNVLLLKPRAGRVDGELAGVYHRHRDRPDTYRAFSWADYAALRERNDVFASLTAHGLGLVGLTESGVTRRVFADIITANYFDTFGVTIPLGRPFTEDEERPGAGRAVVILSHGAWRRLGGTADVLGREVQINLRPFTIVGVAPGGFGGSMVLATPELWVPTGVYESMAFDVQNGDRPVSLADPASRDLVLVARLRPGATIASLEAPLADATRRLAELDVAGNADHDLQLAPLSRLSVSTRPQVDDELTGLAAMLLSLAVVVLVIASFNLANMLLARGQARKKELAIRLAIGGSRSRLVRQLLTESVVLALVGGAGGVLLSWWGTRFVLATLPAMLPMSLAFDPTPDLRVLGASLAASLLAAMVFGVGPGWTLARTDALPELKEQAGELANRRILRARWLPTRDLLVVGQLALTIVMLSVAGLFVRGAIEAAKADPGFTLDRGIIVNVDTSFAAYSVDRSRAYFREVVAALRALPGVEAAGLASHMPFGEFQSSRGVQLPGTPLRRGDPGAAEGLIGATTVSVSSGYFEAAGIRVLRGRDFTEAESFATGGEPLAIIDTVLGRRLFGDEDPVGRQVQMTMSDQPAVMRVVGVVGGVRPDLFSEGPQPFIYSTIGQVFASNVYLHARTSAASADAEAAMLPGAARRLQAIDPQLPPVSIETRPMFRERNLVLAILRSGAWLFAIFGAAALFLAAVGVYGVKSYLVSRRTREIGIRVALGAEPRRVVGMVIREGALLMALGLGVGAALSIGAGALVRGMLFQGRALDVPVIALASATLALSVLLASWLPARRAARVDPTTALRAQ